jgi:hypothetical protein
MRIRSSFLVAALALLATFALERPSQASSVTVRVTDSIFVLNSDFFDNTISSITLTFSGLTGSPLISNATFSGAAVNSSGNQTVTTTPSGSVITLTMTPVSLVAGSVNFYTVVPSGEVGDLGSSIGVTGVVTTSDGTLTNQLSFSAIVPEPASMSLLGIGMTSFLAFRRFFKRASIA